MTEIDRILSAIPDYCSVEEIVDLCGIDEDELVTLLREHIIDNLHNFKAFLSWDTQSDLMEMFYDR
jgi:hypothetical protein